jgi:hypothetical protein
VMQYDRVESKAIQCMLDNIHISMSFPTSTRTPGNSTATFNIGLRELRVALGLYLLVLVLVCFTRSAGNRSGRSRYCVCNGSRNKSSPFHERSNLSLVPFTFLVLAKNFHPPWRTMATISETIADLVALLLSVEGLSMDMLVSRKRRLPT